MTPERDKVFLSNENPGTGESLGSLSGSHTLVMAFHREDYCHVSMYMIGQNGPMNCVAEKRSMVLLSHSTSNAVPA